ncbi:MAG: glycosyltransferase family 4 protein [Deltaproteobacteria bacterium]|nr:glycosyltransferase family 4 protein [Deltaproteobacteria bacterium]
MKVALVGRGFSLSRGGAERVAVEIARALKEAGCKVDVYVARAGDGGPGGVKVTTVPTAGAFSALRLLSFNRNIRDILLRERYDCVLGLTQFFPLDIYRAGGGVYAHWMRLRYKNPAARLFKYITSPVHLVMRWLEKKIMEPGNHRLIIANSMLVKGHLMECFGLTEDYVRVVYNGVDHGLFNPGLKRYREDVRRRFGIPRDSHVALFVSNNWKRKGLETLINALAGVPSTTAVVIGRGNKKRFLRLAQRRGVREGALIFAGPTENVERFYGAADFFVLPTRYDPCSNVCMEAMASGLPVITTRANGASEFIVEGENGYLLREWDDHAALARLFSVLRDGPAREAMGKKAHEKMRGFTWERTTQETLALCEALLKGKEKREDSLSYDPH